MKTWWNLNNTGRCAWIIAEKCRLLNLHVCYWSRLCTTMFRLIPLWWDFSYHLNKNLHVKRSAWLLKMGPIGYPETSLTTNQHCVTCHKREDLLYAAAEAWTRAFFSEEFKFKIFLVEVSDKIAQGVFFNWQKAYTLSCNMSHNKKIVDYNGDPAKQNHYINQALISLWCVFCSLLLKETCFSRHCRRVQKQCQ